MVYAAKSALEVVEAENKKTGWIDVQLLEKIKTDINSIETIIKARE